MVLRRDGNNDRTNGRTCYQRLVAIATSCGYPNHSDSEEYPYQQTVVKDREIWNPDESCLFLYVFFVSVREPTLLDILVNLFLLFFGCELASFYVAMSPYSRFLFLMVVCKINFSEFIIHYGETPAAKFNATKQFFVFHTHIVMSYVPMVIATV